MRENGDDTHNLLAQLLASVNINTVTKLSIYVGCGYSHLSLLVELVTDPVDMQISRSLADSSELNVGGET